MQINQIQNVCVRGLHNGTGKSRFFLCSQYFKLLPSCREELLLDTRNIIRENKMVARVFICQASEYDKLLELFPKKLKVDIDCLTLGGVL